jgi:pimeloyl-ACP methyl ester carboxylesterase
MIHAFAITALLAGAVLASPAAAQGDLPRKPFLGVQLQPAPGGQGVAIGTVFPEGTAARLGMRPGDLLIAINGTRVAAPADVIALTQTLSSGQAVALELQRGGKPLTLRGKAQPRPLEKYSNATVDYGSVAFGGGRLRDVLVMPAGVPDAPVLYFIQGFSCGSVEGGARDELYYRLGEELVARGIGYYRVEKVGQGDSQGPLKCQEVDFRTETDGFRTAYRHLVEQRKVVPDRIFMFGHSLGGLTAPLLAAETAPRGIAVYGTVVRNWADYHRDLDATQSFLISGEDPAETAAIADRRRDVIRMFYFDKMAPAALARARPELVDGLRNAFNWDGDKAIFGRNYLFAQQLAALPLLDAWKKSRTNILSIYGGSDMVALTDVDHRYLADVANYWRPGSGTYVEIADTDHGMALVGSRDAIRARNRSGGEALSGPFNVKVAEALAGWIKASMARPPLAS